jgi:hypothetical protein
MVFHQQDRATVLLRRPLCSRAKFCPVGRQRSATVTIQSPTEQIAAAAADGHVSELGDDAPTGAFPVR